MSTGPSGTGKTRVLATANTTRLLGDIQRGRIPPGSLIAADEGSMISLAHLAAITEYVARHGCKLVLAGDQEQLAATWERSASLRLRSGDATALDEYDQHGRIRGAPPDQEMP